MRFAHVNGQKICMPFVVVINLRDVADLATKRRSSKAPEHQHQRAAVGPFANMEMFVAVQRHEARIRRVVAHFQFAPVHVWEGISHPSDFRP